MADYTEDQKEFYDDVLEDGGKIYIIIPTRIDEDPENDAESLDVDPILWEGSSSEPDPVEHIALFDYVNRYSTESNKYICKLYIPFYNLETSLSNDMQFRDEIGNTWQFTKVFPFTPDGKTIIFYDCEASRWP